MQFLAAQIILHIRAANFVLHIFWCIFSAVQFDLHIGDAKSLLTLSNATYTQTTAVAFTPSLIVGLVYLLFSNAGTVGVVDFLMTLPGRDGARVALQSNAMQWLSYVAPMYSNVQ